MNFIENIENFSVSLDLFSICFLFVLLILLGVELPLCTVVIAVTLC